MKVLFVGGTGVISSACTRLAVERGLELFLLKRGSHPDRADGSRLLVAAGAEARIVHIASGFIVACRRWAARCSATSRRAPSSTRRS